MANQTGREDTALPVVNFVETTPRKSRLSVLGRILWAFVGLVSGLAAIFVIFFYNGFVFQPNFDIKPANQNTIGATDIPTPTSISISGENDATPEINPVSTPVAVAQLDATLTVDGESNKTLILEPAASDMGWLVSSEDTLHHFGDSFLYTGIFEGEIYISAFQFDLISVPRGAPIKRAYIELTGLRDDRLAVHNDLPDGGNWAVRLLDSKIDQNWRRHNFQDIFNASVLQTLTPILNSQDLLVGQTNKFELSAEQIDILASKIIDNEKPVISFRMDGPLVGADNLFAWDTGYGVQSNGVTIFLTLVVGPPPATPPAYDFIVITSTPTPLNVVTAAALVNQMTAEATEIGTATPLPSNLVTATPYPAYLVITETPVPQNLATFDAINAIATAIILTTGVPPSIPTNAVTATPTPTSTPTATSTPTPIPTYILITSTPTAESLLVAATLSAQGTASAKQFGTPTPLPTSWVTPIVVTVTPTPLNEATVQAFALVATAQAFTTGTPTPTPGNMVTATLTPVFNLISFLLTPTPTATPTPLPEKVPLALVGKILFISDRETGDLAQAQAIDPAVTPVTYVYDPATGDVGRLTDDWPYNVARERNHYSADTTYQIYTKQLLWTNVEIQNDDGSTYRVATQEYALHRYDHKYKVENIVHRMGTGIVYDPVWSPTSETIAFVATESGNDEIWIINSDGTYPTQLTKNGWEWDKSPTWSPDGKQIAFMSNRTGNQQLWIMNADGSDQRLLMGWDNWTPYNDWAPVWVIYPDPVPIR